MGISKISRDKYRIRIELGKDMFGKRLRLSKIFNGKYDDAIKEEEKLRSESEYIRADKQFDRYDCTFKNYSELFLQNYCKGNVSLVTEKGYRDMLERINPIIGKIKLNKIDAFTLDGLYRKIKMGKNGKPVKENTVLHYYRLINLMFNQAIRWDMISTNPNLKTIKPKKEKIERKVYDTTQVKHLLNSLENENIKYRLLITLALDTGARRGEICALKWSDVDFDNHVINIDNSLKVIKGKLDEKNAKNISSIRKVIITDKTIDLLKEYKKYQDDYAFNLGKKWKNEDRIFTDDVGHYMHPDTCNKILGKIIKKYNMPHISFHDLRHTSASILIDQDNNIKAVSKRLGHSSTSTTMDIYTHAFDSSQQKIVDTFEKLL